MLIVVLLVLASTAAAQAQQQQELQTADDDSLVNMLPSDVTAIPNLGPSGSGADMSSNRIIMLKNTTTCTMYSKKCFVRMIVLEPATLARKSIKVKTATKKIVEFKAIESCAPYFNFNNNNNNNNTVLRKECRAAFDNYTHMYKPENFFLVRLRAKLVGIKKIEIEYTDTAAADPATASIGEVLLPNATTTTRVVRLYHKVIVTQPERFIDTFQMGYIVVFSILISVIMGILLDLDTLIKIIKAPFPVLIGFFSQYFVMPMLTFGFIHLFKLPPVEALALFIYGCSPGGSSSNNWTIIFNGDIDLSAMMTFVSTMTSIFMMPLWIYTLGRRISYKAEITIPVSKLVLNLLTTIVPCLIGLLLSHRFPILKKFFMRIAKKLVVVLIISFLLVTLAAKYYIFNLITLEQWLTGPLIPWTGFLLGAFLAWITRRPPKQIFTISIETGMQNVGIAFLIITLNFPSPQSDYALLPLVAISTITTVPLWILLVVKTCVSNARKVLREYRKNDGDNGGGTAKAAVIAAEEQKLNIVQQQQYENNTPV